MKHVIAWIVAAVALALVPALADEGESVSQAESAALAWLALTDAGAYDQSWDAAASIFRSAITQSRWQDSLRQVRAPLGGVHARRVRSARYTQSIPGAPAGEYVIIQYQTMFDSLSPGYETVTPFHEADGSWKVSGYYIFRMPPEGGAAPH